MFCPDENDHDITDTQIINKLVQVHGKDVRSWSDDIPEDIKEKARLQIKVKSLCPSFESDAVRDRVLGNATGQPVG